MRENRRPDIGSVQSAPSVPAALEKIASATQRVISKRIDLVMLENHELVSTLIARAALISFGVVVALSAWFAAIAAVVFYLMPNSGVVLHLAVFAAINAAVGAIVVAFGLREQLPTLAAEVTGGESERQPDSQGARQ